MSQLVSSQRKIQLNLENIQVFLLAACTLYEEEDKLAVPCRVLFADNFESLRLFIQLSIVVAWVSRLA